jgi:hypothetical protein
MPAPRFLPRDYARRFLSVDLLWVEFDLKHDGSLYINPQGKNVFQTLFADRYMPPDMSIVVRHKLA